VEDSQPRIAIEHAPDGARAVLLGRWGAADLADPANWAGVQTALQGLRGAGAAGPWDLRQIQRLDHTGAQFLWNTWGRQWPGEVHTLPAQRAMLERVARFSVAPPPRGRQTAWGLLLALGVWVYRIEGHIADALRLLGQLLIDNLRLWRAPEKAPWRDISGHLYRIGATALPITALVGFLIGVVLAYLMSQQLRQFGADAFIVNILGMALIRELGPMLAAILIAGRSGSAITAQIGVMRVTEELDAMKVMGIARGFRLVMPRAIAMSVAMPLLAVWTTVAALLGGMLASDLVMGLTPAYFVTALAKAVDVSNLWLAVGKSAVFGLLIALIACHYGLRIKPNTQSLGEGTTASVVTSITMVILVDALFAVVFKDVGI
jgi:phospholipid/cholesterol/gamma-HCH transport system permease protein